MSLVRGLAEVGAKAAKKTAPFYSAVDEALANLKRPKGTGAEFLTEVMKTKGVKKAEIADRKLEEAFKAKGKITKEEAQQILKENPPPKLQERVIDDTQRLDEEELKDIIAHEMFGKPYDQVYNQRERSRVFDEAQRRMDTENGTRYGDYKTPGGENYREILLKLPEAFTSKEINRMLKLEADLRRGELPTNEMQELLSLKSKRQNSPSPYHSSHWSDDPNVLAHMRVQDRTGPNGEKILHVEEIQSDWHQSGRKKGYANPEAIAQAKQAFEDYTKDARERLRQIMLKEAEGDMKPEKAMKFVDEYVNKMDDSGVANFLNEKSTFNELYRTARDAEKVGVPDAPFKKNWHELAMKRLLNYAADNGYDSIAITPGAEQAKRYRLSNVIDEINVTGRVHAGTGEKTKSVALDTKDGRSLRFGVASDGTIDNVSDSSMSNFIGKSLDEVVGKDISNKIMTGGTQTITGQGLEIGGEGMKGFYDKMLPDYLNNYGKSYGAQVQMDSVPVSTRDPKSTGWDGGQGDHPFMTSQDLSEPFDGMVELLRRNPETGEHELVGRMLRADSEARIASELMKLDKYNQIKLHNFPITPEMRESIKQKGLPLYQQIGIPTAGAGAASQMPEPEEEQGLSGGGMVNSAIKQAHLAKLAKMRQEMAPRAEAVKNLIAKDANSYLRDVVPNSLTNPEIEAEIARMAARAKAAGQQEGVLPTAQRDANLAKFLEESKIKNRVYHGTGADVQEFKPSVIGAMGPGTYVTTNPDVASGYSKVISHRRPENNPNVLPLHVQVKNPFPISSVNRSGSEFFLKFDPTGKLSDAEVIELAKKAGYDAVHALEEGELNIFDPSRIKSSIGNRGTYDVNELDIKKADGGAINYNTAPDMSDGGRIIQGAPFKHGGKVNMTANRDAMFMELSNKKLKRK